MIRKTINERLSDFFQSKKSKEREKEKNKKEYNKWRDSLGIHVNSNILKLDCRRLPKDLLKFSQEWPVYLNQKNIRPSGGTIVQAPVEQESSGKITIKGINDSHKNTCRWDVDTNYVEYTEEDSSIKLINNKKLFLFYDPMGYRLRGTRWFSFVDKLVYEWWSFEEGEKGFYRYNGRIGVKPIPYKKWIKNWKDKKGDIDDY